MTCGTPEYGRMNLHFTCKRPTYGLCLDTTTCLSIAFTAHRMHNVDLQKQTNVELIAPRNSRMHKKARMQCSCVPAVRVLYDDGNLQCHSIVRDFVIWKTCSMSFVSHLFLYQTSSTKLTDQYCPSNTQHIVR